MAPPPPPPMCLPFTNNKSKPRRLSWSSQDPRDSYASSGRSYSQPEDRALSRNASRSTQATLKGASQTSLTFHSDSEKYDNFSENEKQMDFGKPKLGRSNTFTSGLSRGNTMTGSKKSGSWGYGWTLGKKKEKGNSAGPSDLSRETSQRVTDGPMYGSPASMSPAGTLHRSDTKTSHASKASKVSRTSSKSSVLPVPAPGGMRYNRHDSSDTLIGSAYERKVNEPITDTLRRKDTGSLVAELRKLMDKENLDY